MAPRSTLTPSTTSPSQSMMGVGRLPASRRRCSGTKAIRRFTPVFTAEERRMRTTMIRIGLVWAAAGAVMAAQPAGDMATFEKLRAEGFERSQALAVFEHFTIDIGPRLTASPGHRQAA